MIVYDQQTKTFKTAKGRPSWTATLKRYILARYNEEHRTDHKRLNLAALGLDRAHRISFSDIQRWVVDYLNHRIDAGKLSENVEALYSFLSPDKGDITKAVRELVLKVNAKNVGQQLVRPASTLLKVLNSATHNLDLGNASVNRAIQEQLDLGFDTKADGTITATPKSKKVLTLSPGATSKVRLSSGGTSVMSSRAKVRPEIAKMSPVTKKAISQRM